MLITKPFITPEEQLKQDLKSCGIEACSRKLIFFVDKDEYDLGTVKVGKAIQINMSVETGHLTDSMKSHGIITSNSSQIKCSVYKYDVSFPIGMLNNETLRASCLILNDAYSINEINDFDSKCGYKDDVGVYNKYVSSNLDLLEKTSMNLRNSMFRASDILKPIYYTQDHQRYCERGETYSIIWCDYDLVYEGHELIDPHTIIEIHDLKTYDTMIPMLKNEIMKRSERQNGASDSINIISDLFIPTSEIMQNGYVFIYESGKGINVKTKPGITAVPYAGFRVKENLISNLQGMVDLVRAEAQAIEAKKGHIRLYYCPLMSGDRIDIKYDDYALDKQPGYNKTTIDKGYTIEDNINTMIIESNLMYTDDGADF